MKRDRMIKLIYRSLDAGLSPRQERVLDEALAASATLREEREQILQIREALGRKEYRFQPGFPERVMHAIRAVSPTAVVYQLENDIFFLFKRFALTAAAAILLLLVSLYLSSGQLDISTLLGIENFSEDDLITYLLLNQ